MTREEMNQFAAEMNLALDDMRARGHDQTPAYVNLWRLCRKMEERANRYGPIG